MTCIESVLASSRYSSLQYEVSCNEFLDGCFEANIVIRTRTGTGTCKSAQVYNIEIDDIFLNQPKRNRLCSYRDEYLQRVCGIKVARIRSTGNMLQGDSDVEVEAELALVLSEMNILD
mgnify:CR=1 FL=1